MGLRVKKFPSLCHDNPIVKQKWEETLNKRSLDLILSLIEQSKHQKDALNANIDNIGADISCLPSDEPRLLFENKMKGDIAKMHTSLKRKNLRSSTEIVGIIRKEHLPTPHHSTVQWLDPVPNTHAPGLYPSTHLAGIRRIGLTARLVSPLISQTNTTMLGSQREKGHVPQPILSAPSLTLVFPSMNMTFSTLAILRWPFSVT